jgi:hypothetical protein
MNRFVDESGATIDPCPYMATALAESITISPRLDEISMILTAGRITEHASVLTTVVQYSTADRRLQLTKDSVDSGMHREESAVASAVADTGTTTPSNSSGLTKENQIVGNTVGWYVTEGFEDGTALGVKVGASVTTTVKLPDVGVQLASAPPLTPYP